MGIYESVATRIVPVLLPVLRVRSPDVAINIHEARSDVDLLALVHTGALDVTFADLPVDPGPFGSFESRELFSDPYLLVVGADTPIGRRRTIASLDELATVPLIGQKTGRAIVRVEEALSKHGVEPEFVFRSDVGATIQAMVATEIGAAVLPRLSVDLNDPRTRTVDLTDLLPPRTIGIAWHSERAYTPALDRFIEGRWKCRRGWRVRERAVVKLSCRRCHNLDSWNRPS